MQKNILLVEDDASLKSAIQNFLSRFKTYRVTSVSDMRSAKIELQTQHYDLILSDIMMPNGSGLELLESLNTLSVKPAFILMTGYGTIEQSVKAVKWGAYDFLEKPFELEKLKSVVESALEDQKKFQPLPHHPQDDSYVFQNSGKVLITKNPQMLELVENLKKIASSKATVLIQGESGTGKEVLASMIHYYSPRRDNPFVAINCAALPDNLLESELFGHEKGSFTGAIQRHIGKFETANGGTILLDEISEMSLNMQTKLLRVLQEREIYRIGGSKPIPLNIRVIASTNRDLFRYMSEGHFREDLFYRINVVPVIVPALRHRGQDVLILANHFLKEFAELHERPEVVLDEMAQQKILHLSWHGNVRELRNAMERATLIGHFNFKDFENQNSRLNLAPIHESSGHMSTHWSNPDVDDAKKTLAEVEQIHIKKILKQCQGNRTQAAKQLGISLRTLRNKLKLYSQDAESNLDIEAEV